MPWRQEQCSNPLEDTQMSESLFVGNQTQYPLQTRKKEFKSSKKLSKFKVRNHGYQRFRHLFGCWENQGKPNIMHLTLFQVPNNWKLTNPIFGSLCFIPFVAPKPIKSQITFSKQIQRVKIMHQNWKPQLVAEKSKEN